MFWLLFPGGTEAPLSFETWRRNWAWLEGWEERQYEWTLSTLWCTCSKPASPTVPPHWAAAKRCPSNLVLGDASFSPCPSLPLLCKSLWKLSAPSHNELLGLSQALVLEMQFRACEYSPNPQLHPLWGAMCHVQPAAPASGCGDLQGPGSFGLSARTTPHLVQTIVAKICKRCSLLAQEELNCRLMNYQYLGKAVSISMGST